MSSIYPQDRLVALHISPRKDQASERYGSVEFNVAANIYPVSVGVVQRFA